MRSRKCTPAARDGAITHAGIKELKCARSYRPPEVEGDLDGRSAAVLGAERVRPQHCCHGTPKDAVTWQNHSLIVLQADPKISPALGFARVPVCQQTLVVFKFVELELKNAGSNHLEEKERRFRTGAAVHSLFFLFLFFKRKTWLSVLAQGPRGRCLVLLHTCDINVVLNAMVKVNQAAILAASPGQPRHQTGKTSLLQNNSNNSTRKIKKKIKIKINNNKIRINPFFPLRWSSQVAPWVACVKKRASKRFQFPSYPKVSEDQYPQTGFLSLSRRPFRAWYCTPQWSPRSVRAARSLFWC